MAKRRLNEPRSAPVGGELRYSPTLDCVGHTRGMCGTTFHLNRYAPDTDGPEMRKLTELLVSVAKADGWYAQPDGKWLCTDCAPSAVERLGELADDRP